jgi:hypothetical protein
VKPLILTEKYPHTCHFPFSEGATNDDRIQEHWYDLLQHELVVTEKSLISTIRQQQLQG